jgi:hypothetical protein
MAATAISVSRDMAKSQYGDLLTDFGEFRTHTITRQLQNSLPSGIAELGLHEAALFQSAAADLFSGSGSPKIAG